MLVAGPNLTIDRTLGIAELRPGEVLRFDRVVVTPGGKGLNVARAAHALGHPAVLVSLLPGHIGRAAAALIADEGIELHAVPCSGELRSTSVIQERDGRTTVLNEPGPPVDEREWAAYERAIQERLGAHRVVDHERPRLGRRLRRVDVRRVGAQHERGLVSAGMALQQVGLADGELDRVGGGVDERVDRSRHVLDAREHRGLAGHAVVDGDVEAAARRGVKESVEAVLLHAGGH